MRSLNPGPQFVAPNDAFPFTTSDRLGFLGAVENANPARLKVAPDTALWQAQAEERNHDPRYGLLATVGMAGAQTGVPKTGTFVDISETTRFSTGSFVRTDPRAAYPLRPIVQGNEVARVNPYTSWYLSGYTSQVPSQQDQLAAIMAKPGVGSYSG